MQAVSGLFSAFFSRGGGFGITGSPSAGWTFTKTSETGVAERIASFGLSDSIGSLTIENASTSSAQMLPRITGASTGTLAGLDLVGQGATGGDSGTSALIRLVARISSNTDVVTRPIFSLFNRATEVIQVTAAGGVKIQGGTTPSLTVGASGTAITQMRVYSATIDPASVAANTTAEQTFTVTGLTTADKVFVNKPTNTAGLGIVNARVSAADTLAITFGNFTAGAIDAASETYTVVAIRS